MPQKLIVDANPLIAALLGGKAAEILASEIFSFYSTQHTLFEVEKYLSQLAEKLRKTELEMFEAFQLLPVTAYQPRAFDLEVPRATQLIGRRDEDDIPLLALALALGIPVWTNDRDFLDISEIETRSTTDLLRELGAF